MVFGGPLLKKTKKSTKAQISQVHLFQHIEPILRTLGYILPNEHVVEITAPTIPKNIPIIIKKEVHKLKDAPS